MKIRTKYSYDERIEIFIMAFLAYHIITMFLNVLVGFVMPSTPLDTMICMGIFALITVYALPAILSRLTRIDIVVLFVGLAVVFLHAFLHPAIQDYVVSNVLEYFATIFILFFIGRSVRDYSSLLNKLSKFSYIMIVVAMAFQLVLLTAKIEAIEDDMFFSYQCLPFVLIALHDMMRKPNLWKILLNVLGFILLIMCGTRGPILWWLIAIVVFAYANQGGVLKKIILTVLFASLFVYLASDAFYQTLGALNDYLLELGIENRIIEKFLSEDLLDQSGRDIISEKIIDMILENPILGCGLYYDRVMFPTSYAHNVFLELLLSFGIPIGFVLFLSVIVFFVMSLISRKNTFDYKIILIVFFFTGFLKLFVSSSFMIEPHTYLFLGILFSSQKIIVQSKEEKPDGLILA